MIDCNAVTTPILARTKLEALLMDEDGNAIRIKAHAAYRTLIGSLLYASTHTHPDIAWAIRVLVKVLACTRCSAMKYCKALTPIY